MTITKAHLRRLFVRWEELNEVLRRNIKANDPEKMEKWRGGADRLGKTAQSYGLDLIAWYYIRTFIDFVDDVNDGLEADERFYIIEQTLRQIGVEITEEE